MNATVIDLQKIREEKTLNTGRAQRAQEGLKAFRALILNYELLMTLFTPTVPPEQLAQFSPLSPEEQRAQDFRRLNALANALECSVLEKRCTLLEAFEILRDGPEGEIKGVIEYLLGSEFPLFVAMLQVVEWSSLPLQLPPSFVAMLPDTKCKVSKIDL